jgi:hypothetical protein
VQLLLKAPDVFAHNSSTVGEKRARRRDLFNGSGLERHHRFDGLKGDMHILHATSSHIGGVLSILRTAPGARRRAIDIVHGHAAASRTAAPAQAPHDLVALLKCLALEGPIDGESGINFDTAAALRGHPSIVASGRPISTGVNENRLKVALDRCYLRIGARLGAGIDVWAAIYGKFRPCRSARPAAD